MKKPFSIPRNVARSLCRSMKGEEMLLTSSWLRLHSRSGLLYVPNTGKKR